MASQARWAPRVTAAGAGIGPGRSACTDPRGLTGRRPPWLRRGDLVGEHADPLDLGLHLVARLEELAERGAHALRGAGGDHVAGQDREALGEDGDALVDREDHLRGVA